MTPADRLAEALARLCFIPCPCCEGEMECHAECTFAEDCPEEFFTQESARSALAAYRSAPAPLTVTEEDVEAVSERIYRSYTKYGYGFWYDMARAALDEFVKRKGGAS